MNNKTLDGVLLALKGYDNGQVEYNRFMDDNHQLVNGHRWNTILEYLKNQKLVTTTTMNTMHSVISITPEGLKFINDGGFTAENQYKDETLQVAKDSKKYAKLAFWISVLGIIVSIILFFLG